MPSIEIICIGQIKPSDFSEMPFAVEGEDVLQSHRSPNPIFQADFDKLQGCIYHLGNPYLRDPDVKTCFFASQLLTDYWKEEMVSFKPEYVPSVQRLLQELLAASTEGKLLFTSDYQFGANPHWYKRPVRLETFWKRHDAKRLPINSLVQIVR